MQSFFFNDPATTEIYTYCHTLSLHDALPILAGAGAFVCPPVAINEGLWIPAAQWELRVDRESAYSAIGGMPLTGDAIISNNVSGLIAIRNGAQAYVSLTGDLMPEPNWADSFVGFRKWEIIHWPTEGGDEIGRASCRERVCEYV